MIIVPALFEDGQDQLTDGVSRLAPYFSRIQIDVGDGEFVPRRTPPIEALCAGLVPFRPQTSFDFHLMVSDPTTFLTTHEQSLAQVASRVLVHYEAGLDDGFFSRFSHQSFSLGLVLNPATPISIVPQIWSTHRIPSIQIMTVNPGLQGQKIIINSLNKIAQLRTLGYTGEILIDGGVNEDTIPTITSLPVRPDILCVGSALVKSSDLAGVKKRIEFLLIEKSEQ